MISLDQILLLEQKVEGAVAKIAQLQAENDALRKSCAELTNALSAKSEQLSSFEQDQSRIESGIIKALDRLNSIENAILSAAGQAVSAQAKSPEPAAQPVLQEPPQNAAVPPEQQPVFRQPDVPPEPAAVVADSSRPEHDENKPRFFESEPSSPSDSTDSFNDDSIESDDETSESDNADNGLFDIF